MTISRPRRRDDTGSGPVCNELCNELAMGSPLRRAVAALSLLVAAVAAAPVWAEDDPYAVTVSVDATSDTIGKARDMARNDGQRKALATLVERLSGAKGAARLPKLDDKGLTDLVASFEVANERMSTVRYVADVTYHFRPAEVQAVLQKAGISLAGDGSAVPGKSLIVLPIYQSGATAVLWDEPNPWRDAWTQQPSGPAAARFRVPLGDAGDIAAIDAAKARAGNAAALAKIAQQNGGDEVIVAVAVPRAASGGPTGSPAGLEVNVRRYRAGQPVDDHSDTVTANPGERREQLLRRAVGVIAADIESGWKKAALPGYDQQGSLTAVLPITGLDDWVRVRERLAALPAIRRIGLVALSLQEATIEIEYLGSIDQLKAGLAEAKLDLVRGDPQGAPSPAMSPPGVPLQGTPQWRLARFGAPATQ
jgi:Uncharacterized protein conserved in bacteria (DUF2066)